MALKGQEVMSLMLIFMVMVWGGARAQSSTCTNTLMGLTSCLNYVTGNSSTPAPSCCSQLATIVQSQPRCLCSLLNDNAPKISVTINQTLALSLPGACQVQTPPLNLCNGVANGPASGPATGPASSAISPASGHASSAVSPTSSLPDPSGETPETEAPTTTSVPSVPSESGSGSGSKSTPSTNNNASNGIKFGTPSYLLLFVIFFGISF